jgi:HTH-type transcriptional regulator, global nitrogen regulator NrpRI
MVQDIELKINKILQIISEAHAPIGSKEIAEKLVAFGIGLSERSVRYHLKLLDEQGLTEAKWKEGRVITKKGREELGNALVEVKIGLVSSRIESKAYLMDFNLKKRKGKVILNLSLFHKSEFKKAAAIMKEVFLKGLSMGSMVFMAGSGEEIGEMVVPKGKICLGTLCTINLNGLLLKNSVPIDSKFGGVLQIENSRPLRFTDLIAYSASTLDPHEIFLRSKMTSVREAVKGSGKILAGLREIPAVAREKAEEILTMAKEAGLGGAMHIGKPGQPVLGMPVAIERVGLVVQGGLNPVAAAEEWGIETESKALVTLVDYSRLIKYSEI